MAFDLYGKASGELAYLQALGPLARPERGTRVGIPLEHQHGEPRESAP